MLRKNGKSKKNVLKKRKNPIIELKSKRKDKKILLKKNPLQPTKEKDTKMNKVEEKKIPEKPAPAAAVQQKLPIEEKKTIGKLVNDNRQPVTKDIKKVPLKAQDEKIKKVLNEKKEEKKKLENKKGKKVNSPQKLTPNGMCRELLIERKYTDEEIVERVKKVFPDKKFNLTYVSTSRTDINKGYYKSMKIDKDLVKLVMHNGKLVSINVVKEEKKLANEKKRQENRKALTGTTIPKTAKEKILKKKTENK